MDPYTSQQQTSTRDLTSIVLSVLVLGVFLLSSYWVLKPFLPAFVWATLIVVASWRSMLKMEALFSGSRKMAVFIMTVILALFLLLPIAVASYAILHYVGDVQAIAQDIIMNGIPDPPSWLSNVPIVGPSIIEKWNQAAVIRREEAVKQIAPHVVDVITWFALQIGGFGHLLIHLLLTIIFSALLYANGERVAAATVHFAMRLAGRRAENIVVLAGQAIRAVGHGVILTALAQTFLALVGLVLARIPYAIIISTIVFLLSIIQIGAIVPLIGVTIWLFYSDQTLVAWLFLIWSIVVMTVDNFMRPYLIKRGADLPLLLIFAGVIGGVIAFGLVGIFIGPVILAVSYTWLQAWVNENASMV